MTSTATDDRQERILSAVRKGQELTLDAIKATVGVVSRVTSKLPEVKLPSSVYDFAEKLLADQRKFASEVLKTTAALRPAAKDRSAKDRSAGDGSAKEDEALSGETSAGE